MTNLSMLIHIRYRSRGDKTKIGHFTNRPQLYIPLLTSHFWVECRDEWLKLLQFDM
jgi:hypothetical protein